LECTPIYRGRFRFGANAAVTAAAISANDLGQIPGCVVSVLNTTMNPICSAVRLRAVHVWPSSQASSSSVKTEVFWNSGTDYNKDEVKDGSLPGNLTVTKGYTFLPPAQSIAKMWLTSGVNVNVFSITCPNGSIVDVELDFVMSNAIVQFASVAITSGALGQLYYAYLDAGGSKLLTPIGRPSA
jgi:hypothetical protein